MESFIWYPSDEPYKLDSERLVIALCTADLEQNPKYGQRFLGPIRFTEEGAANLDYWSEWMLDLYGGYVHWLFLEPGAEGTTMIEQAEAELAVWVREAKEDDEATG